LDVWPKDSAIRNVISRREPHWIRKSTLSTSGRVTVSFKYWQLHSTGRHRYSSYRIADFYRESPIDTTVVSAEAAPLPRMCSFIRPRSRSFLHERSRMSVWFYDNVGRLPNRRANMTCTILYSRSRLPSATPFPDFPLPRPHILFARWSSRICMYAFRTLLGKRIA